MMPDGQPAKVHEARLIQSGHVVGLYDLAACDHYGNPVLSEEWRGSLSDRILREFEASAKNARAQAREGGR